MTEPSRYNRTRRAPALRPEVETISNCTDKFFFRTEPFKIPFRLYQHEFSNVTNQELNGDCVPESYQSRSGYNIPSKYGPKNGYKIGCYTRGHTIVDLCDVKLFYTPKYREQRQKLYPNITGENLFRKDHNNSKEVKMLSRRNAFTTARNRD